MDHENDPTLTGEMLVYRRIPPNGGRIKKDIQGNVVFTKSNFQDGNNELSLYIVSETTPELVLRGHDGFGLVVLSLQSMRECNIKAAEANKKKPQPDLVICRDEEGGANPGHIIACGNITKGMANYILKHASWVDGYIPQFIDSDEEANAEE